MEMAKVEGTGAVLGLGFLVRSLQRICGKRIETIFIDEQPAMAPTVLISASARMVSPNGRLRGPLDVLEFIWGQGIVPSMSLQ